MDHPTITIGDRVFPVPPLSLGQIKIVVPTILRLKALDPEAITAEQIEDLIEIAYQAALKGTPDLTRAEFTALPGTVSDLVMAYPIVAKQAGMEFKAGASGENPASP